MPLPLRDDTGQASLDYLTVLAVVAAGLVLAVGVATAHGRAIAVSVTTQMARALCIVTGGDCYRDRTPCVVDAREKRLSGSVSLALVRIGKDQLAIVEERSDGRFDVTIVDGWDPGLEGGLGGSLRIPKTGIAIDGELRAAALAHLRKGRTWTVDSAAEAKRLVDRASGVKAALLPEVLHDSADRDPDITFDERGWSLSVGASAELGQDSAELEFRPEDFDGARRDLRTGHVTHYLRRAQRLGASLSITRPDGSYGGDVAREAGHVWAIEVDERGRPVDLMIIETDEIRGSASLPPGVAEVAGRLGLPSEIGQRYEVEEHLDLTDPANLRAAMAFIRGVVGPFNGVSPGSDRVPVAAALRERLDRHGTKHLRSYTTDEESDGGGGTLAAGLKFGAGYETSTHTSTLVGALTRGPGGIWRERADCLTR